MSPSREATIEAGETLPRMDGEVDRLTVERLPGEYGPLLRCRGDLTLVTSGILRQELERLEPMGHPVVTVNLSGCEYIDVDGLMTLLQGFRRLRETGRTMTLVAGGGSPGRLLQVLAIDSILPVFPTEEVAARALRGAGPPPAAPVSWAEAREKTLERWRVVEEMLERDPEEALRQMTSMFALCDRSEELYRDRERPAHARCQFCPLFHALGGRDQDFGCRSVLDPLIEAVRAGETGEARAMIDELVRTINAMPGRDSGAAPA